MDPYLYKPIFLHFIVLISILSTTISTPDIIQDSDRKTEGFFIMLLSMLLILFVGYRPIDAVFADMVGYAEFYESIPYLDANDDKGFFYIAQFCNNLGFSARSWFCFLDLLYMGGAAFAVYKIFEHNCIIAFAVVFASFSFFSYGVNGVRNGIACSTFLLALAALKYRKFVLVGFLCFLAFHFHKSLLLTIVCLALVYFYNNTLSYFKIWILCIILSLVAGSYFESYFVAQDIIDTGKSSADYFSNSTADMSGFSVQGFRYDFLLYSSVPIFIGCYFVIKQKYEDSFYKILLNLYIICNSVWVLINANWLSNRIAYLSWFMYGFVMMYPVLESPVVHNRARWVGYIVLGNAGFSYLMWIIGKYM